MTVENLVIFGIISFFTAIGSGMSGGGGAAILTPLAIFLGLTPQQAVATGKFNGLVIALGSLHGFRKAKLHSWKIVVPLMGLAFIIGLLAPLVITRIDNESYRVLLGILLIATIPVLFINRRRKQLGKSVKTHPIVGYILLAITLAMLAVFSNGVGMLINIVLMTCMGMNALEASVAKRFSTLVLNAVTFFGVVFTGLVVWQVAAVTAVGSFVGGHLGAKVALKKGEDFIIWVFAVVMLISGLTLLLG